MVCRAERRRPPSMAATATILQASMPARVWPGPRSCLPVEPAPIPRSSGRSAMQPFGVPSRGSPCVCGRTAVPSAGAVGARRLSRHEGASSSSVRRRVSCPRSLPGLPVGTPPGTSSLPRPILRRLCFSWSRSLFMRQVTRRASSSSRHPICRCTAVGYSRNPATKQPNSRAQRGPCSALRFHGAEPGTRRYAAT